MFNFASVSRSTYILICVVAALRENECLVFDQVRRLNGYRVTNKLKVESVFPAPRKILLFQGNILCL